MGRAADATGMTSLDLDAYAEKTAKVTITKKLKPTANLVYDLLVANGFPYKLKIEDGCVVWIEKPEKAPAETRDYGRRILLGRTCDGEKEKIPDSWEYERKCGTRAQFIVHGEKRGKRWAGCEYRNILTCRRPAYAPGSYDGRDGCPNPETVALKMMREGFMVSIEEIPYSPEE